MSIFSVSVAPDQIPEHQTRIDILTPVSGLAEPLTQISNPLYSQCLFGDGVAIKVSGFHVVAPFDCLVLDCPPTAHRIRLKDKHGVKLQIQCGIGAEKLHGVGLKAQVKTGQKIKQGTPLLEFDMRKMKHVLTSQHFIVTVLNNNKLTALTQHLGRVTAPDDVLLSLYI